MPGETVLGLAAKMNARRRPIARRERLGFSRFLAVLLLAFVLVFGAAAQDGLDAGPSAAGEELTLSVMLAQGGFILWVLIALSFVTFVMAVYFLLTITVNREAPLKLVQRARDQVRAGEIREAYKMVEGRDELLAKVLYAGLRMSGHERFVIQESMESEGERGATALWQRISYLNNIGNIAPLLGLLGTVWGMIGAFSAIALDSAQVKGLTMAYSVSQAMITTAAGLLLAIPAMAVYFYLRGRVVKIVSYVEAQASEFVELIVENDPS